MIRYYMVLAVVVLCVAVGCNGIAKARSQSKVMVSPDNNITVTVLLPRTAGGTAGKGAVQYKIAVAGQDLLGYAPLGIIRADQSFAGNLRFVAIDGGTIIDETYTMPHGKRSKCHNHCNEYTLKFQNDGGADLDIIFRVYNDGVAFRYRFPKSGKPGTDTVIHTVTEELTGFQLPPGGRVWLHPSDKAGKYTPAYETYYLDGIAVGTPSPNKEGWSFPVLFRNGDGTGWGLITEALLDGSYCGCRLQAQAPGGLYRIGFPDAGEGNHTGSVNPSSVLPWSTPWRVIIIGKTLAPIVESTMVQNLNPPSVVRDTSWIKPGRVSWSWLFDHDSPQDHDKLLKWIDLSAAMGWEYSLIDANWTIMKNGTIHDLVRYANRRGIGLLLWYNSGGRHNVVTEKPRGDMELRDVRRFEFALLKKWGIKGVKVDFFQSDKQNIIRLYRDILQDAADYHIMVNFHGCTLPRGWTRTYPHLMSMEAVKGEECYSFDKRYPKLAPTQNTILPFTRNAVGPMDYTPVMFWDNVYPHLTSYAHELAQAVVFESGWMHFADGYKPYLELPTVEKQLLKDIPVAWDDIKFIAGYPGQYVVIARRKGSQWFIGGMCGDKAHAIKLDLSFIGVGTYRLTLITDGEKPRIFSNSTKNVSSSDKIDIAMQKYGGFVVRLSPVGK